MKMLLTLLMASCLLSGVGAESLLKTCTKILVIGFTHRCSCFVARIRKTRNAALHNESAADNTPGGMSRCKHHVDI
ncbi:hypothetical protein LSAT2_017705 [Lamellibrachia satsuma]|nr:hypothetical protein LSAT2_017705 [Lamellibrachia satsuma]